MPNLYPALERQEVVVHTPRHARSLVELSHAELSRVASTWRERAAAARGTGFRYVQVLVNEGRAAGASLPHSHSQIGWFREHPPAPASERVSREGCGVCELIRGPSSASAVVGEAADADSRVVAFCHPAGRLPYEVFIAPVAHEPEPWEPGHAIESALRMLGQTLHGLHGVEGAVPINAWLHCAAFGGDGHWHLELLPRLTVLAGLELGAGIWINTLAPEEAAERLRDALR